MVILMNLVICVEDEDGNVGKGSSVGTIQAAQQRPLSEEDVKKAVGVHLGEASLVAAHMNINIPIMTPNNSNGNGGGVLLPAAEIKEARRHAVEAFLEQRRSRKPQAAAVTVPYYYLLQPKLPQVYIFNIHRWRQCIQIYPLHLFK
jgi:hypothetical protein